MGLSWARLVWVAGARPPNVHIVHIADVEVISRAPGVGVDHACGVVVLDPFHYLCRRHTPRVLSE